MAFLSEYMKVHEKHYDLYLKEISIAALIGYPVAGVINGLVIDYFGPKHVTTIYILNIVKAFLEIPSNFLIFD